MRKFENIVKSHRPPSRYSLWLDEGKLKEFFNGEWVTVLNGRGSGDSSSGSIDSEALDNEIKDRKEADKQLQNNIDTVSKRVTNHDNTLSGINSSISDLQTKKQDKLVQGTGIKLTGATISVDLDLSGYVKDTDLEGKLDKAVESAFQSLDLSSFETTEHASNTYQPKGNYLTQHQSLDNYYTKLQVDALIQEIDISDQLKGYAKVTDIPSLVGYATENWVLDKNYLTEHQSLEGLVSNDTFSLAMAGKADVTSLEVYAKTETVESLIANVKSEILGGAGEDYDTLKEIEEWVTKHQDVYQGLIATIAGKADSDDLDDMATMTWVKNQNYLTKHQDLSNYETIEHAEETYQKKGNYLTDQDISDLATKEEVSNIEKDIEKKIPSLEGYATTEWVKQQQYLTEHQDISNLATKDDIKDVLSKIEIVDSNSKELGSVIEAGNVYYNNAQDKTISTFTGFDNNNAEAIIISAYPIIFDNSSIRKAQYIDYLVTENGTYVYTLKSISTTSNYIIVNCTIYEE